MTSQRITGHVFIATSLDGFIARPDGGIDWLDRYAATGEDHGYVAFMSSVDGIVMGRGTYETALSFGGWPYEKPVIVMSATLIARKSYGPIWPERCGSPLVTAWP